MKKMIVILITGLGLFTQNALGCDESCLKEKIELEKKLDFPGYLTWKYCEGLKLDFMTTDMRSLESYSTKHFDTKYKGPIKNTVRFIDQRKEWLGECDQYLQLTGKGRVFDDKKTTDIVFGQMDSIKHELKGILDGASYSSANGDETKEVVGDKFGQLFKLVDDHKTLLHLKGRYVFN
ncbi:MAG: hypothetical protein ACI93R_002642 [Flavobacteriales bacterium]|jgi:hypothetical protein